jgi:hypothetical protein
VGQGWIRCRSQRVSLNRLIVGARGDRPRRRYTVRMRFTLPLVASLACLFPVVAAGCGAEIPNADEGDGETGEGEGETGEGEGETGEGEGETGECVTNADCSGTDVCLGDDVSGTLVLSCEPPIGDSDPGQQCTAPADCATGLCGGGSPALCSAFCETNGDCPANQTCGTRNFTVDGVLHAVNACVTAALTQLTCTTDAQCNARNQTCSALDNIAGLLTPVCDHRPSGDLLVGDVCTGSRNTTEFPAQCESGFCDGLDGRCIDQCAGDGDCGAGFICTDAHQSNLVGRWCAEPCDSMGECLNDDADADSRVCRRRCDADAPVADRGFDHVCGPPVGTLNGNTALAQGQTASNCKSGFSITQSSSGTTYCSEPCAVDADCPQGTVCTFTSTTPCPNPDPAVRDEPGEGPEDGHLYCRRPG